MKVSLINYSYNKNIRFQGNQNSQNDEWTALRDVLMKRDCLGYYHEEVIDKTNSIPTFKKPHFEYTDYKNLSRREKLIINLLNKIGKDEQEFYSPRNLTINKYAEHILDIALKTKEELDNKYPNGYKLVGIGRSPAPFVETMQLIGSDAITMPFSRQILYGESFPYEYIIGGPRPTYYKFQSFTTEDWKNYFKYFGLDNESGGKKLIFTDSRGMTLYDTFKSIVKGLNYDEKYTKFISSEGLFHHYDYKNFNVYEGLQDMLFKHLSKMISVNHAWGWHEVNPYKHPEFIPSLPETFMSKLFRCALYDLMSEKNLKIYFL